MPFPKTLAMIDDDDDDDDFQNPTQVVSLAQNLITSSSLQKPSKSPSCRALRTSNGTRSSKKTKRIRAGGKENAGIPRTQKNPGSDLSSSTGINRDNGSGSEVGDFSDPFKSRLVGSPSSCSSVVGDGGSEEKRKVTETQIVGFSSSSGCDEKKANFVNSLNLESSINDCSMVGNVGLDEISENVKTPLLDSIFSSDCDVERGCGLKSGYFRNSIESRLLVSRVKCSSVVDNCGLDDDKSEEFEPGTQLSELMNLCSEMGKDHNLNGVVSEQGGNLDVENLMMETNGSVECPLCGIDISDLSDESRQLHTNMCLDSTEASKLTIPDEDVKSDLPRKQVIDVSPVLEWLNNLGLSRYNEAFIKEEIDWDTLKWLTEEDLISIGVTALGPRKKIAHALNELKGNMHEHERPTDRCKDTMDGSKKLPVPGNKLITEFFQGSSIVDKSRDRYHGSTTANRRVERSNTNSNRKRTAARNRVVDGRLRDIPPWCCIPGTPFRVDAFRFLRADCSHWFLTHFHLDHYQGLTRSFCHGKVYCSSITARLVHTKIGVPWDRLQVLPLNQKVCIAGIDVTCLEANHCPGAVIVLFEPPNNKAILHTGDFRFCAKMASIPVLQTCSIHTLILDTTYCNPQYDFPKQEAVIQFVIEAIQAEAFNPKTLFLIGSYTIGKERLFLEVARCLRKKVYVGVPKLRLLECLELPQEDMQWFTSNEQESQIHVVPMWTIASFKRMKHIVDQYSGRYDLIVAFSPTGWTFGKGKKKTPGRRWQQGTIIRYEVPYSEHSSFTELREFVQFLSPEKIVPSVNNSSPESSDAMIALLMSES
ncbi:hypothetical protein AAC387_Pa01g1367 [Persea americana]